MHAHMIKGVMTHDDQRIAGMRIDLLFLAYQLRPLHCALRDYCTFTKPYNYSQTETWDSCFSVVKEAQVEFVKVARTARLKFASYS